MPKSANMVFNPKQLLGNLKADPSAMDVISELFSKKEIQRALEITEMATDVDLMHSITQSKTNPKSSTSIPWDDAKSMSVSEIDMITDFEELGNAEKINVLKKGARYLYSKKEIDRAFEIIDTIQDKYLLKAITQNRKEGNANSIVWEQVKKEISVMPSHLTNGASKNTRNS